VNLGDLEAGSGRWGRAERHYRRALRDAPDDPSLLNNLAESLLRQGRSVAEAESLAVRAVARAGAEDSIPRATLAAIRAARRAP
jgi:Flp pilus assembly protein TadD